MSYRCGHVGRFNFKEKILGGVYMRKFFMIHFSRMKQGFALFFIAGLVALGGCAKYKARPLSFPSGAIEEKKNVSVTAYALNDDDMHYYFSRRAIQKGLQPVQLTVVNNSKDSYFLDAKDINLNLESRSSAFDQLRLSKASRCVGWGVAGLFLWPFLIPAAVELVKTDKANKDMRQDFVQRVIDRDSRLLIKPGQEINRVFFVSHSNVQHSFDVTLTNMADKKELSFLPQL
jgi:hypothetical protein